MKLNLFAVAAFAAFLCAWLAPRVVFLVLAQPIADKASTVLILCIVLCPLAGMLFGVLGLLISPDVLGRSLAAAGLAANLLYLIAQSRTLNWA